jgi:hypothetical protein
VIGVQIFPLYAKLLSDKSCQPWEKIVKTQTKIAPEKTSRERCMTNKERRHGSHFATV